MRAILPGRPQSKRQALSTADWDGLRLVAYISGNAAVIASHAHSILQTLYLDASSPLHAIAIEESSGRIAICDNHSVYVYDPVGRDEGLLRWQQAHEHKSDGILITSLSWASIEELVLGGSRLRLWYLPDTGSSEFIWDQPLPYPTALAYSSPDGELIASCGLHDRMVKVWRRLSYEIDSTRYDVSYLSHPTSITNLHWRKPWHTEQNLDNLLYTFCADNRLRVWAHVDHHSASVMQHVAEIDMCETIQPRRLSVGSMSRRRYAFIIDSRDFSTATEKAVQNTSAGKSDHALEHLIQVANRSPEIFIVLDGLGHMSAWGLENAGCKNKNPTEVFNITHVADLNVPITQKPHGLTDYTQFCIFAGGATDSSLSILVHSFDGSISWHDAQITHLFDTAPRQERARLLTSWAGHDDPVKGIVRSEDGKLVCSWTEDGDVIVWKADITKDSTSLILQQSVSLNANVIDADFFGSKLVLTQEDCLRMLPSGSKFKLKRSAVPMMLSNLNGAENFGIFYKHQIDIYNFNTGKYLRKLEIPPDSADSIVAPVREPRSDGHDVLTVAPNGVITGLVSRPDGELSIAVSYPTAVQNLYLVSAFGDKVVLVDENVVLTIWDSACEVCEAEIDFGLQKETVYSLDWYRTRNGGIILAVACIFKVVILAQTRYGDDAAWNTHYELRMRDHTGHAIGTICLLADGSLVVGAGNQLFVPDLGIAPEQESSKLVRQMYFQTEQSKKGLPSLAIPDVVDALSCILPLYHPEALHLLLNMDRLELVVMILVSLHEQLKFFSDGDELPSFLDININTIANHRDSLFEEHIRESKELNGHNSQASNMRPVLEDVAERLKENIERNHIPFLSFDDQSKLAKLIDVVVRLEKLESSVDAHALCYLHTLYSCGSNEMPWLAIMHASLSTSQEALVDLVTQHYGGKLTWEAARRSGLFMWLSEAESVRTQMENVGRAEYTKHEDRNPVDCSLFYLALHKKSVLQGLWRTSIGIRERDNTMKLLANNFNEQRWKSTALKNAYALLSKRRFEYAAAFFLLGGSLKDAVNLCVHQLHDPQLAIAISRVYADDGAVLKQVIEQEFLPAAAHSLQGRWMTCWAYHVMLNKPERAVQVLVRPLHQVLGVEMTKETLDYRINDPMLAGMYAELRLNVPLAVSPRDEWNFVLRCATYFRRMGCDFLAMGLVRNWEFVAPPAQQKSEGVNDEEVSDDGIGKEESVEVDADADKNKRKEPPPTQFVEPSADSLLDSFGF